MPAITGKVIYDNLVLKPPLTIRIKVNKTELAAGRDYVGKTVEGKTVRMVAWGTILSMCPEDSPECTAPSKGVEIAVVCDGSKYTLQTIFGAYYVSPQVMFVHDLFAVGKETDLTIDVTFRDSRVSIVANGNGVIDTDMLKKFGSIRQLAGNNRGVATDGTEVDLPLQHLVDITGVADIGGILSSLLPVAISVGVLGAVFGLLRYALPKFR